MRQAQWRCPPSLPLTVQSIALCADAVSVLGPCAANAGFSLPYSATVNNAARRFDVTAIRCGWRHFKGMISNAANTGATVRGGQTARATAWNFDQATGNGNAGFFRSGNPANLRV